MKPTRSAAIYARISDDREGAGAGVDRQLADCHRLADDRGWNVGAEYVDNDISAFTGRVRPRYAAMLSAIEAGQHDMILAYHLDRLHRIPLELEELVQIATRAGVNIATVQQDVNLGSADGLMVARMMVAVSANASAAASRRIRRKNDERAEQGKRHGSGHRPFGYERDGMTIRDSEAEVLRDLARRLLAGESISGLTRWLNDNEIPTSTGSPQWLRTTLRQMLANPSISGLRVHRGELVGPAAWPPIISVEQGAKVRDLLANRAGMSRRPARRYLLAGMLRCHKCGHDLHAWPSRETRHYVCKKNVDRPTACGSTHIIAEPVEDLISKAVLIRLDTPALQDALTRQTGQADETAAQLTTSILSDQDQLQALAVAHGQRVIPLREWLAARRPVEQRLQESRDELGRISNNHDLGSLIGTGSQLRLSWPTLALDKQRVIVGAVLDNAEIGPGVRGRNTFDKTRVRPTWRI
ncbi:MAG TPA: recombinase family protein [Acidothermaceae bacterium]|jgi:DNA invertase Pin-like site-specific DNA recombinase